MRNPLLFGYKTTSFRSMQRYRGSTATSQKNEIWLLSFLKLNKLMTSFSGEINMFLRIL
jgi:hypothetical protein